jgi:hypothetical protein
MSEERTTREVKQKAKAGLEDGKERIAQAAQEATEKGKEQLSQSSERAATGVDHLADAVGSAASRLTELEHEGLADYANRLASYMSDMSAKLREKNVDELAQDVRSIAQRNPALFVLGSVAVGLGLSRFAKATRKRDRENVNEFGGNTEWRTEDQWRQYENGEYLSDARSDGASTDRQMTPDATGGSGL